MQADPTPLNVAPSRPNVPATENSHPRNGASSQSPSITEPVGLCIICQDQEAIMAGTDCGHLAMCTSCSDAVMSSSRKCPLCRRGIERLIRIYKL
ncbi:hypothetical protein R3P38DRAFT_2983382 [Favolaschia claudopus]|uniref:RING-type domain-containing protein n=1 Tax=Favolaschia claudopus TaxID=2862362 RepID=A0AAW0AYR3_9AGAR